MSSELRGKTPVTDRITAGLSAAADEGIHSRWESVRQGSGRERPVKAGFDPWKAKPLITPGMDLSVINSPEWAQMMAARAILKRKRRVKKGHGRVILDAMSIAAEHGLVPPDWLAAAFNTRIHAYLNFDARSLDSAFKLRPLTERKRVAQQEKLYLIPAVHSLLRACLDKEPTRPVAPDLFQEVGEFIGIGATKCRELYDEGVRHYRFPSLSVYRQNFLHVRIR